MRHTYILHVLTICLALGCGDHPALDASDEKSSLTVEEWKQLPVEDKYDETTFDRLRAQDPAMQSDLGWDRFMRAVVIPERKKDISGIPGQEL